RLHLREQLRGIFFVAFAARDLFADFVLFGLLAFSFGDHKLSLAVHLKKFIDRARIFAAIFERAPIFLSIGHLGRGVYIRSFERSDINHLSSPARGAYPGAMRMYMRKTRPSKIQMRLKMRMPIQLHFFETRRTTPVMTRMIKTNEKTP